MAFIGTPIPWPDGLLSKDNSLDRLLRFLHAAGCDVNITVRRPGKRTVDTIPVFGALEAA